MTIRAKLSAHFALWALIVSFATSFSLAARADAKSCAASHASGQREVRAGHLRLASELFTACGSDETCPQQIRTECAEFLQSLKSTIPTVILSVVDDSGYDVSEARVFSSDELISERLEGRTLELDPGPHRLRFVLPDGKVVTRDVLIREGEKNRLIEVRLGDKAKAAPLAPATAPSAPQASEPERRPNHTAAFVVGGVSLVSLGAFAGFALVGTAEKQRLDACAPNCGEREQERYETMKRSYLIADVGLGVGVTSALVSILLFVTGGQSEPPRRAVVRPPRSFARVKVDAGPRDASLVVFGKF